MSWELNFEKEETIGDALKQAGLCGSFQKEEEAVLKLKKKLQRRLWPGRTV